MTLGRDSKKKRHLGKILGWTTAGVTGIAGLIHVSDPLTFLNSIIT